MEDIHRSVAFCVLLLFFTAHTKRISLLPNVELQVILVCVSCSTDLVIDCDVVRTSEKSHVHEHAREHCYMLLCLGGLGQAVTMLGGVS
jgi:hypothetical protein